MSLWPEYKKAVLGTETLEDEKGLISFNIMEPVCYIDVIYVRPEFREQRIAAQMADTVSEIARGRGCTDLHCQVWLGAKDPNLSLKVILAYGFKLIGAENNRILLSKSLLGGPGE